MPSWRPASFSPFTGRSARQGDEGQRQGQTRSCYGQRSPFPACMHSRALPYLLTLPSLFLAAVVIFWPVWDLIQISMHDVNRFGQLRDFNDFANFSALINDPDFIAALWRTGLWTVLVVGGALLLSIPVAL